MWKDLTQQQKADLMDIYLKYGITSLSDMQKHYDLGGHIYSGNDEPTQQMQTYFAGELPEVTAMPQRYNPVGFNRIIERTDPHGMTMYYWNNPDTGQEEMLKELGHGKYMTMDERSIFDVPKAEAILAEQAKGTANDFDKVMLGTLALGTAPITLPGIATGVSTALANPYVDAGLTSYFGAHGLNHAINEGIDGWGDAAMTALEVTPLGRLAKPVYEGVVQPGMRLFNSPLTGNWTKIGNKEYRLSPNSLGANGSPIESRKIEDYSVDVDVNKLRDIFEDYEKGLTQYKGAKLPDPLEYKFDTPEINIDFSNLTTDNFVDYLSKQTGRTLKRVPIKDTTHGDIYNEGFAFIDENGKEVAHIAGTRKGGKNVWVESSFVDPEFRYKGLGKQMYFDLNDYVFNKYGTTLHSNPYQRVGSTGVGMSPSNRLWKSLREKGLSSYEGEGFNRYDVMAEPSKITTAYRTSTTPQITAENASTKNSSIIRTVQDNGKIRLSLPSHTKDKPRQFVLEPQRNNKFYVHMRTWDGDHIPANLTNEEKQQLFDALYNELPDNAEILFPKSGPRNYATRGTVAGLQRLARDSRFIPGTKGTLQYLDKDGKTIKTYEGTSFIKAPRTVDKLKNEVWGLLPFLGLGTAGALYGE